MPTQRLPLRRGPRSASLSLACAALAAMMPLASFAAALTWDSDTGTTDAQDGSGTWTTAAGGWWDGSANVNWANGDTATFGAGTDAGDKLIELGGAITTGNGTSSAGGMHFANSGYSISATSGTILTLGSGGSFLTVATGKSATIGTNVTARSASGQTLSAGGGGTLNVTETGAIVQANNNLFNIIGGTTISVGTAGTLSAGNSQFVIGTNSGSGTLVVDGGTVTSSSTTTSHNIILANNNAGTAAGTLTVNSGTVFYPATAGGLRFGSSSAGDGTSTGILNLNGGTLEIARLFEGGGSGNTQNSTANFNGGTLKVRTGSSNASNYIAIDNAYILEGGAIIDTNGVTTTIAQPLQHGGVAATDGGLVKRGTGTLTLSGNNSYTGDTIQESPSSIVLAHSSALGTGMLILKSTQASTGTTITVSGGITVDNEIEMDSTTGREWIRFTGDGDAVMNGNMTITGSDNKALVIENSKSSGNATWNGNITGFTYAGSVSLRSNPGKTGYFNGVVNLGSNLDLNDSGNWVINAAGSNYGATRIQNNGKFIFGADDALDTSARVAWTTTTHSGGIDLNGFDASVAGLDRPTLGTGTPTVSNNGATDSILTLAALEADRTFAGNITDGTTNKVSLVIHSAGRTQTLSGINTYTGTTTVSAGALALAAGSLTSPVTVADDAVLGFTLGSTVTSTAALTLESGALIRVTGTPVAPDYTLFTAASISGALELESPVAGYDLQIDGTALKLVASAASGFASWIDTFPGVGASDQPGDDPDNDGVDNLLEFVLNGDPTAPDASILPTLDASGSTFIFTFARRDDSLPPETTQTFQYGSDLDGWTDIVVPADSGPAGAATITVTDGSPADTVQISIPKSEAGLTGKLFGRLQVTQP